MTLKTKLLAVLMKINLCIRKLQHRFAIIIMEITGVKYTLSFLDVKK